MNESTVLYKCRRCERRFDGPTGSNYLVHQSIIEATVRGISSNNGLKVELLTSHTCDDGGSGVGDLLGASLGVLLK